MNNDIVRVMFQTLNLLGVRYKRPTYLPPYSLVNGSGPNLQTVLLLGKFSSSPDYYNYGLKKRVV